LKSRGGAAQAYDRKVSEKGIRLICLEGGNGNKVVKRRGLPRIILSLILLAKAGVGLHRNFELETVPKIEMGKISLEKGRFQKFPKSETQQTMGRRRQDS